MSMLNHFFNYKPEVLALDEKAMELCQPYFRHMEEIRDFNQLKMLKAFADTQMSSTDMLGTTGYGLWDTGRAKLEQIFAEVMGAEDALVRSQFQSGTHTLAVALFGLLRAGDTLLAATGRPYDTLEGVIGLDGKGRGTGTLMDYGIRYDEAPLKADFTPDYDLIAQKAPGAKVCHIQRSRGYLQRNAFDLETIRKIADTARAANPDIIIFVDNCYGEFTQTQEPCQMGADLVVGSLIKNPGGGIAPTGGYIAGRKDLVELCAYRLNAPGLGKDLGCTLETPRDMYLASTMRPAWCARLSRPPFTPSVCWSCWARIQCRATATTTTTSSPALMQALRMRSSASVRVFRLQAPWTAMPPRNLLRSRAILMRWSWQAAALHRAAPSSFPATARCVSRTPATCRAV